MPSPHTIEWVASTNPAGYVDGLTLYCGLTAVALVTLSCIGADGRRYRIRNGTNPAWRGHVYNTSKRACFPVEVAALADHEADLERVKQAVIELARGPRREVQPVTGALIFWTQRKALYHAAREARRDGFWLVWREGYKWGAASYTPDNLEAVRGKPGALAVDRYGWCYTCRELDVRLGRPPSL